MRILRGNDGGFTLIELLIVVIIIGILATLAFPRYVNFVEKARAGEAIRIIGSIRTAQELYFLKHNIYSIKFSDLGIEVNEKTDSEDELFAYKITDETAAATGFTVKASRTPKDGGTTTQYIEYKYTRATQKSEWSGNHPGVP